MNRKFSPPVCPVCGGYVYFAEEIRAMGRAFHKCCFKCCVCNKTLDSYSVNDHEGELFCKSCYAKNFGPNTQRFSSTSTPLETSYSVPHMRAHSQSSLNNGFLNEPYGIGDPGSRLSPLGREQASVWDEPLGQSYRPSRPRWIRPNLGGVRCANCPDVVYANERVEAVGKVFHRLCFKCASCRRLLDRGTACDHKREIFCQNCYTKHFGSTGIKAGTNLRCE